MCFFFTAATLTPRFLFAQSAVTPFALPFAASPPGRPTIGLSIESGRARVQRNWVTPIAGRLTFDYQRFSVASEVAYLSLTNGQSGSSSGISGAFSIVNPQHMYTQFGVRVVSGVSYTRLAGDKHFTDVPIALLIGHRLPPPNIMVLPWIAPRVQLRTTNDTTKVMAGISMGFEAVFVSTPEMKLLSQSGFRVAADVSGGRKQLADNRYSIGILHKF